MIEFLRRFFQRFGKKPKKKVRILRAGRKKSVEECAKIIKMPQELVKSVIDARRANKILNAELEKFSAMLKETLRPGEDCYLTIISELAEGKDINKALKDLPDGIEILEFFNLLQAVGFTLEFLADLILEINPEILNDNQKQELREKLMKCIEQRSSS